MAELARGKNCPACGTITACSGKLTDYELYGQCGCCGRSVVVINPDAPEPVASAEPEAEDGATEEAVDADENYEQSEAEDAVS